MATVTKSRRAPEYIPSQAEIEAAKAEIDARRLAKFDAALDAPAPDRREYQRQWRAKRKAQAAIEASLGADLVAETNALLQQNDQSEPIDLDDHRDPRQTEQWLPVPTVIVPTTAPPAEPNDWAAKLERQRRELIQMSWDSRREQRELAADADRRGVLNFYNINRTTRSKMRLDGVEFDQQEMLPRDIANVELLEFGAVDEMLGMVIDAAEAQHEMEDLNCRWGLGDVDPETMPVRTVREREPHDVVAFRSKRK